MHYIPCKYACGRTLERATRNPNAACYPCKRARVQAYAWAHAEQFNAKRRGSYSPDKLKKAPNK